jgi:hypothetical protein
MINNQNEKATVIDDWKKIYGEIYFFAINDFSLSKKFFFLHNYMNYAH